MQYSTVDYSTVQCSATWHRRAQYTIHYSKVQRTMAQHSTIQCNKAQHGMVWYWYDAAQQGTSHHSTAQHKRQGMFKKKYCWNTRSICKLIPVKHANQPKRSNELQLFQRHMAKGLAIIYFSGVCYTVVAHFHFSCHYLFTKVLKCIQ